MNILLEDHLINEIIHNFKTLNHSVVGKDMHGELRSPCIKKENKSTQIRRQKRYMKVKVNNHKKPFLFLP